MAWGAVLVIAFIVFVVIVIGIAWRVRRTNSDPGYYSADPTGAGKADHVEGVKAEADSFVSF